MTWFLGIIFSCAGAAIGSFLNVVIDRLPEKKSIVQPPSHCPGCDRQIESRDLIPIVSYLWLRGKCRYCSSRIPLRILLVEISTALLFLLLLWRYGLSMALAAGIFYTCLFIVLTVIDLERQILPNALIYPSLLIALLLYVLLGEAITGIGLDWGYFGWQTWSPYLTRFINSLLGGSLGFILLLIIALASRGGMGMGDVKLAGLIGLMTGFPLFALSLFTSVMSGGILAALLLLTGVKKRKDPIPFGPFLCLGAMVTLIWGDTILMWYLGLM